MKIKIPVIVGLMFVLTGCEVRHAAVYVEPRPTVIVAEPPREVVIIEGRPVRRVIVAPRPVIVRNRRHH